MKTDLEKLNEEVKKIEAGELPDDPTPETAPAPAASPTVTPKPDDQPPETPDATALQAQLAERDARIAELTRRINGDDGRRGGELNALRGQLTELATKVSQLASENEELRKTAAPAAPSPEDETERKFDEEYGEVAQGINRRTGKALTAAERAQKAAEDARKTAEQALQASAQDRKDRFFAKLDAAVPNWETVNSDPKFIERVNQRVPGTPYTLAQMLAAAQQSLDVTPIIEAIQQFEAENGGSAAAPGASGTPTRKGPAKPDPAAQAGVPHAGGAVPSAGQKTAAQNAVRMKELEDKIFQFRTATKADTEEYERLVALAP